MLPLLFCLGQRDKKGRNDIETKGCASPGLNQFIYKRLIFSSNPLTLPFRVRIGEEAQSLMLLRKVTVEDSDSVAGVGVYWCGI